ncbi:MAG: exonuclease [Acidobacteriota bacterium]
MSLIAVDVEADGPIPGTEEYSMIAVGAVVVDGAFETTFRALIRPISQKWLPEALAVSGYTREQTLAFEEPVVVMRRFARWVTEASEGRPVFISDNLAFDWMFTCWYFHHFTGGNPFGFSGRRIGDVWAGMQRSMRTSWKHLRTTRHSHDPLDDAKGNAEALWKMHLMGVKL